MKAEGLNVSLCGQAKVQLGFHKGQKRITDCKFLDNLAVLKVFGMKSFASGAKGRSDDRGIVNRNPVTLSDFKCAVVGCNAHRLDLANGANGTERVPDFTPR